MFDMFKLNRAPAAPAPAPANAPAPAPVEAPAPPADPLDKFESVWAAPDPTKQTGPKDLSAPIFDPIDPTKLQASLGKLDFARSIPAGVMEKIAAGGPESAAAITEAMNAVARQTMSQATMAQSAMMEAAFKDYATRLEAKFETAYTARAADDQVLGDNPAFKHPAISPLIKALRHQVVSQNPGAAPSEIAAILKTYTNEFANAIKAPEKLAAATAESKQKAATTFDWEKWASMDNSST